jgi:hypothetical protein
MPKPRCYPANLVRLVRVKHSRDRSEDIDIAPPLPYGVVFKRLRALHPKASIRPLLLADGRELE